MTSGSSTPRWRARARTRIQPEAKAVTGSVRRRVQRSCSADGGQSTISPGSLVEASLTSASWPRSTPSSRVELAHARERAVQPDRLVVAGGAQQRDQPLRLAEAVGADEMGALREGGERGEQAADLARVGLVAEHRQPEGRLRHEQVAGHQLEGRRGRDRGGACSRRRSPRARPLCSITTWALPRMWPAGASRTVTPPRSIGSP